MTTDQRPESQSIVGGGRGRVGTHSGHPMPFEPSWYRAAQAERAACCGDCQQGRKPCASPQACRQPDAEDDFGAVGAVVRLWPALLTAWLLIVAVVAFFWLVTP